MAKNILKTEAKRTVEMLTLSGAEDSSAIDMKDYESLLVGITPAVITGDVTAYTITGYTDSSLTLGATVLATGAAFPTAVDDVAWLEIGAGAMGANDLRYVKVTVTGTDTDKILVIAERGNASFPADGLTADVIT